MEGEEEVDLIYINDEQADVDTGNDVDGQDKEEYYDDGVVEENEAGGEQEGDLNEEAYEIIRDEDDILEEAAEDPEKEHAGGADEKGGGKEDSMLVLDELDNNEVESISDEEDQTKTEDGKELIDPEQSEKALLHMPSLKTIMGDLLHLRRNRRVSVYPVSMEDLALPTVQQYLDSDMCEEVKMQFIRPTDDMKTWTGFLSLMFVTSKNATQAVDVLKNVREGLNVKIDQNPDATLDSFLKEERKNTAWPSFWADRLLLVRRIPIDTKPDDLRAIFTDAEEIVVAKESASASAPPKRRDTTGSSAFGYAYVLYESAEAAKTAAENLMAEQAEFRNKLLDIQLYREPVDDVPRSLLFLRRRRLVLKHLDRLLRNVEKSKEDPDYKLPPNTESRIEKCKALIEKDDKARADLKLPTPTFEDFKQMRGFRPYTPKEAERALFSLGIVMKNKKAAGEGNTSGRRDKDRAQHKRSEKNRGGNAGRGPAGRGNFRQGPGGGRDRRSPPGGRRRNDWGPGESRRGDFMGRNRNGGSRGMNQSGGMGMVNPLALMMQQNMGLFGASGLVNPAVLNPMAMMMQPSVGNLMNSSGMTGQGPLGGGMEPPPKMLRLDETGNLRAERDFREGRGFDRGPRDDRNMFRDRGRQRSRSPDFRNPQMRTMRGGLQRSGFGNGGPRGYEPPGNAGGPRGGEDDLSLLMNLSHMLSQTMEQKRHQTQHGYDRV